MFIYWGIFEIVGGSQFGSLLCHTWCVLRLLLFHFLLLLCTASKHTLWATLPPYTYIYPSSSLSCSASLDPAQLSTLTPDMRILIIIYSTGLARVLDPESRCRRKAFWSPTFSQLFTPVSITQQPPKRNISRIIDPSPCRFHLCHRTDIYSGELEAKNFPWWFTTTSRGALCVRFLWRRGKANPKMISYRAFECLGLTQQLFTAASVGWTARIVMTGKKIVWSKIILLQL